jgi:hypothetical protein
MLKEYQRLRPFENGVLKRKFGHRRLKKVKQCRISSFIHITTHILDDKSIN